MEKHAIDLVPGDIVQVDGIKRRIRTVTPGDRPAYDGFTRVQVESERVDLPAHRIIHGYRAVDLLDVE